MCGTLPFVPNVRHRVGVPAVPALVAVSALFGRDLEACLARIERTVRIARSRGASLIVFPESALGGYLYEPRAGEAAAVAPPPALPRHADAFDRLARVAGPAVLCVGYTEEAPGGPYSSAICLSGDGVLGHHRKVHLPPGERGVLTAGEGFAAFDTPLGRFGMLICYDKVFPESARALALDGAELVACIGAWPVCRARPARLMRNDRQVRHFNALDVVRAVENQVVWVAANQYGPFGRLRFLGQAKIVDPDGRVLATTGAHAGLAVAHIDPRVAVRTVRDELCHLGDRVPAAYGSSPSSQVA
jgi:N-carbamoylputrescine amidase